MIRVAKQLVRKNRDVVGAGCVKDNVGKIVVKEDKLESIMIGQGWRTFTASRANI